MKIAVWYNLPSGGAKRALYYHVRGLVERGHQVEIWCPPTADRDYLPLSEFASEHVVPLRSRTQKPRGIVGRSLKEFHAVMDAIADMDEHCGRCAEQMRAGGFDLLFANTCMMFAAAAIGRHVDMPKVLYLQEPYRDLYEARPNFAWAAQPTVTSLWRSPRALKRSLVDMADIQALRIKARQERLNAEAYDAILVNSYFSRESVIRAYNLDAKVCYLGIDTALFADQHLPREDFVVGLGQISPHKNPQFVIEAVAEIPAPRPRLVWIGNMESYRYAEELQQFAQDRGVEFEAKVRISNEELRSLLNRARLMLYAPRLEPFGFAPLEGNACGLPVVAVAEGGVRETVVDGVNGLLVESTPQAMGAAAVRLLRAPSYAAQIGQDGHRVVSERWSLPASIDRLEKAFSETLSEKSSPRTSHLALV